MSPCCSPAVRGWSRGPKQRVAIIGVVAAMLLMSCGTSADQGADGSTTTSPDGPDNGAVYETELVGSRCADPTTDTTTIDCYTLTLPEDRTDPTGRQVELPVIRVRSPGPESTPSGAPIVYLHGGPGGGAVDGWLGWQQLMSGITRDFITFDQRGGGHANPRLDCPEHSDALATTLAEHPQWEQARKMIGASLKACNERLSSSGVDLAQYDTHNSVLDLEDLRRALGAEKLALVGVSYGTRLALEYQSSFPERVESLALGGVVAPGSGGPEDERTMLEPALSRLFESCADDTTCRSRYPDLKLDLESAAKALDAAPVTVGADAPVKVTGDELHAGVFAALYDSSTIPLLPATLGRISSGDSSVWSIIGSQIKPLLAGDGAFGAQISINCGDLASAGKSRSAKSDPGRSRDLVLTSTDSFCEFWPVGDSTSPGDRPSTDTDRIDVPPTLVVAGELDPITPASDARSIATELKGRYIEVPRGGHDAMLTSPCARSALRKFMTDQYADEQCPTDGAPPFT